MLLKRLEIVLIVDSPIKESSDIEYEQYSLPRIRKAERTFTDDTKE